jgi:hypothetical protein
MLVAAKRLLLSRSLYPVTPAKAGVQGRAASTLRVAPGFLPGVNPGITPEESEACRSPTEPGPDRLSRQGRKCLACDLANTKSEEDHLWYSKPKPLWNRGQLSFN